MAQVTEMVRRSLRLANLPFEAEELLERAKDWSALLYDIVPLDKLKECFEFACKRHDNSFAVNAYEVLQAFRLISEIENAQKQRELDVEPKRFCNLAHNNEAEKLVELGSPTKGYKLLPCPNCRPEAFRQRQIDLAFKAQTDEEIYQERVSQIRLVK